MPKYSELTDDDYIQRVKDMDKWLTKVRDADRDASYRYLDLNIATAGSEWDDDEYGYQEEADVPDFVPVGQTNYLAINNETKMAAIAMGTPTMHVRANEDPQKDGVANAGEIVAKSWEASWKKGNWKREFKAALQKKGIIGSGFIRYYWDSRYGPCFEHVPYKRLLLDPNATNLTKLDYGGVILSKSVRKALRLYDPDETKKYFEEEYTGLAEGSNLDKKLVKIYVYWDGESEVHIYQDKVVHKEDNDYKEVPIGAFEGFVDPRDKLLPLGDNVFAQGLNQGLFDLTSMAFNVAKHGQQITLGDSNYFDTQTQQAIKEGKQQQIIFTKGKLNPQALPLVRIAAERLSETWDKAYNIIMQALDGIMGTTPGQRGQQLPNVTATQSVMVENRSGARPTEERADYEALITWAMEKYVMMMQRFGGPTKDEPGTDETRMIWQAFKAVYDVRIVDGSASFEPPAADKQSAMQGYTTMVQSMPMWLQMAQAGVVQQIPNMQQWADDLVMAFKKQNKEQYWTQAPQPQQQQGPPPELINALKGIYKDSPPDVKKQIEQHFGLDPSQLQEDDGSGQLSAEFAKTAVQQEHEARMQENEHHHEAAMESIKQEHDMAKTKLGIVERIKAAANGSNKEKK